MRWLFLTVLVLIIDQISKWFILSEFSLHVDSLKLSSWLHIVHACNTGAAFSFLSEASGWQRWFFAGLAFSVGIAMIIWLIKLPANKQCLSVALALIIAGAFGNGIDRITVGCVVDFIQVWIEFIPMRLFNPWPAFNIADSAIFIGAILLIIDSFFFGDEIGEHN